MKPDYRKLNKDGELWSLPNGGQAVLNRQNKMLAYRKKANADWNWVKKGYRA